MTTPAKRTTAQVWQALEAGADEAELARIAALDEDALDRELIAAGIDPAEAAEVGNDVLQAASSDAHVPAAATSRPRAVDRPDRPKRQTRSAPAEVHWATWVAMAAVVVLVLTAFSKRREIEAWFEPPHIEKDREAPPREPTPEERAAKLREDAYASCRDTLWAQCRNRLDEAQKLDPAGEADPRVQAARDTIRQKLNPPEPQKPGRR
jgi:hypothetical protein